MHMYIQAPGRQRRIFIPGLLMVAGLLSACQSESPLAYWIYDHLPNEASYRMRLAVIESLSEPRAGRGSLIELRGGGLMRVSSATPSNEAQWLEAIKFIGHKQPDIQYSLDEQGAALPWDFDSAMLLTLYHHFEQGLLFFEQLGLGLDIIRPLSVHYFPRTSTGLLALPIPLVSDNAAYVITTDSFVIMPRWLLGSVPLFANRGVIVHELSHLVFNRLIYQDARVPPYLLEAWPRERVNEQRSLDEGVADAFAALQTGNPNFIAASISQEIFGIDRGLAVERFYDEGLRTRVVGDDMTNYDPYPLGSVVAASIWALGEEIGVAFVAQALLESLRKLGGLGAELSVAIFADELVGNLAAEHRHFACQLFHQRFVAIAAELRCGL